MLAAYAGRTEIVRILLKQPLINVNLQNAQGETALIIALKNRHEEVAKVLLQHPSIDAAIIDSKGNSANSLSRSADLQDTIIRTISSSDV